MRVLPRFLFFGFLFCWFSFCLFISQAVSEVEIVTPRNKEVVNGEITIQAQMSGDEDIEFCEFYIQEPGAHDRYGWKDYDPPYSWGGDAQQIDTTLFDDGWASVVAFCYGRGTSSPITEDRVKVLIDNGKPKIKITSPKNEEAVTHRCIVDVDAVDEKGISKPPGLEVVLIYLDGGLVHEDTDRPYHASIDVCLLPAGWHSICAVGEDSEGLTNAECILIKVEESAVISSSRKE